MSARRAGTRAIVAVAVVMAAAGCGSAITPADEAVRACETATACGLATSFQSCIHDYNDVTQQIARTGSATFGPAGVACVARAGHDCDAAARCTNLGDAVQSCSAALDRCDGDVVRGCLGGAMRAFDCATVGLHCVTGNMGGARCAAGPCAADGSTCSVDGAKAIRCSDGVETQADCTVDEQSCVYAGPSATCGAIGTACDTADFCDGDFVVACEVGHRAIHDCAARGLHCEYLRGGRVACANGTGCDDGDPAACENGRLHYCYLGAPLVADCKAAGFSGCAASGCVR